MYCVRCGKQISADEKFCPACGTPVTGGAGASFGTGQSASAGQTTAQWGSPTINISNQQSGNGGFSSNTDKASFLWLIFGMCFGLIGLICYFIWRDEKPARARLILRGFFVGIVTNLIIYFFFWDDIMNYLNNMTSNSNGA